MQKPKLATRMQTTRNMVDFINNNTMDEYKSLFEKMKIKEDMTNEFMKIAQSLFNDFIIVANDNKFRLAEIEFYFFHEKHKDNFIHSVSKNNVPMKNVAAEKQIKMGHWYFHYSGIDLTFGNGTDSYGGILLRSIICENDRTLDNKLNGPLKLKNYLLNEYKNVDSSRYSFLYLTNSDSSFNCKLKMNERIGLGEGNSTYKVKRYNFSIK